MFKIISYFIQSIVIYFFFLLTFLMGIYVSRKIFSHLFLIIGPFFRSKNIVNKNLNIFSSKKPNIEKKVIVDEMWKNYGKTFVEYVYLSKLRINNSHITIVGEENLRTIKENNKPVIFISGHFANFELMSMEITKKKIKLATIYRPLNNIFLNFFMEFLRKKYICKYQIKKGINGVRETIEYIKKGFSVALMVDQRVSEGEKMSFFGKDALTTTLPAQLSIKFDLEIVPVFIQRNKDDSFLLEFQKPISCKNFKNKNELTKELNKILEKMIEKNPYQWIWTHNRWK